MDQLDTRIPMAAQYAPIDPVGSYAAGVGARQNIQSNQNVLDTQTRANNDRAAIDAYLASGGDIYTPDGLNKAVSDLKGKVSSDNYMKLLDHATKSKADDVNLKTAIQQLDAGKLGIEAKRLDRTLTFLAQPLATYNETKSNLGEQEAEIQFNAVKNQILTTASAEKNADGSPAWAPEMLQMLQQAGPAQMRALVATTAYQKGLIDQRFKESQIERNLGLAAFDQARAGVVNTTGTLSAGGKTKLQKLQSDLDSGLITQEQFEAMKAGIIAKESKDPNMTILTPEAIERAGMDHYMFGNLPARATAYERALILNESAKIAASTGDTTEESVIRKAANKANQVALNDLTKRESLMLVFEKDADKRLTLAQELAKKADASGVPALNRWLNAGRAQILGDVDVNNLNSVMIGLQAELAKVLSGALGNTAVSDSARAEAAQIINAKMTPEQIDGLVPYIRQELKFKMDSYREQRQSLQAQMRAPSAANPESNKIPAATQADRDKDAVSILRKEYSDAKAKLAAETGTDPESVARKTRYTEDISALKRELAAKGVKDPDATAAPAPAPAVKPVSTPAPAAAPKQLPSKNAKGWELMTDKHGNKAYVSPDKTQFEEVK